MLKSQLIKNEIQKGFEVGNSKIADKLCYGYTKAVGGSLVINEQEAQIVRWIFERYISGDSLGKIADGLAVQNIPSPTGKPNWNRQAIDKITSNEKYLGQVLLQKTIVQDGQQIKNIDTDSQFLLTDHHPAILSNKLFAVAQAEKARRSNVVETEKGTQRKTTKYHSSHVLSGLLICQECGSPYRRITRHTKNGKEIVWRCANRVEHGKEICKHSPTISDEAVKKFVSHALSMTEFNEQEVRETIQSILVKSDATLSVEFRQENLLSIALKYY